GKGNTQTIFALRTYTPENYPVFGWCQAKNKTAPEGIFWYIPAKDELLKLRGTNGVVKDLVGKSLVEANATPFSKKPFLQSSTEKQWNQAWCVGIHNGEVNEINKWNVYTSVRAVSAF
ncbi:MAG: hypothetical protein RR386_09720, partial [Bacteroidaceae bacterium]